MPEQQEMTNGLQSAAQEQLKAFLARVENLEEDKKQVADDIKEVYAEAKAMGFDTKVLRKIVAIRKIDANEYQETKALVELYLNSVGLSSYI